MNPISNVPVRVFSLTACDIHPSSFSRKKLYEAPIQIFFEFFLWLNADHGYVALSIFLQNMESKFDKRSAHKKVKNEKHCVLYHEEGRMSQAVEQLWT